MHVMSVGSSSERALSNEAATLLAALLDEALLHNGSADASRFRAIHYDKINEIEWLETAGHIKRVNEHYVVTATALIALDTTTARGLLTNAELVYGRAQDHYRAAQAQRVSVQKLAREANLSLSEVCTALSFMLDLTLWCGGWSTNLAEPDAYIIPTEGTLKYSTFAAVIAQVREWRLQQATGGVAVSPFAGYVSASISSHETPRPNWLDSLQEPLREVMGEVYRGVDLDLRSLSAMGIRAVIDMVLVGLVGDVGGFDKKLSQMVFKGLLTEMSRSHMLAAIEAGNAAAHRGHIPDRADLHALLKICENLLYEHFVVPGQTQRLRANTPVRAKPEHLAPP